MPLDQTALPSVDALHYLRGWRSEAYTHAALLRSLAVQARLDASSNDASRERLAKRATGAENVAGRIGHAVELLERDLASWTRRRPPAPVRQLRFADAGSWPPGLDHPDDPDSAT